MIVKIFIAWIIIQLLIIGFVCGLNLIKIHNNNFECDIKDTSSFTIVLNSTVNPLVYFISDSYWLEIKEYCNNKRGDTFYKRY